MPSSTIIDSELGKVIDWKTKMTKWMTEDGFPLEIHEN